VHLKTFRNRSFLLQRRSGFEIHGAERDGGIGTGVRKQRVAAACLGGCVTWDRRAGTSTGVNPRMGGWPYLQGEGRVGSQPKQFLAGCVR